MFVWSTCLSSITFVVSIYTIKFCINILPLWFSTLICVCDMSLARNVIRYWALDKAKLIHICSEWFHIFVSYGIYLSTHIYNVSVCSYINLLAYLPSLGGLDRASKGGKYKRRLIPLNLIITTKCANHYSKMPR